ncbi:MAG TPA: (2Fe-2S)-binding protein [Nitrolancea sp.]|jgi:bacterioferritin-associated ferredoxin|nr:(2Fe-2S)-binding protein [Nitrolancea sp.]
MGSSTESVVYVCRCEEIDLAAIEQAIAEGALTINDVKRRTRAGMGVCQGIFCTRAIADLIHQHASVPLDDLEPMTARPPARLLSIDQLVALDETKAE